MTFNNFLQMIIAALFFMVFTFCTWYEGSEIMDRPWEWKYSTHFTQVNDDQALDANDISNFDHFVYAAKFKPLFPFLMVLAASYLIILTGYILFKRRIKKMALFLLGLGILFLLSTGFVSNSPTVGGDIFQAFFLIGGMMSIIGAALYFRVPTGFDTEI
ncbi:MULTISPECIES: YjdJ family protein [Peribacillus]|uniref:YjdJ family protein n=1 Tax=Peribacillus TaxID=2675229 RepID=UPI00204047A3|nr:MULTISPECIES: YjdJ family protein [Peribacillus]MCM3675359.1 YjdJ family protein [Peribacillus simplex]MDQ0881973.1 drug/metabolite transporter (DMT)-like permease [Peribacillus sp. V2I11]